MHFQTDAAADECPVATQKSYCVNTASTRAATMPRFGSVEARFASSVTS
jgi:hypothetical protein